MVCKSHTAKLTTYKKWQGIVWNSNDQSSLSLVSMVNKGSVRRYFLCAVAIVNSATNGYDGSMMNGLQSLSTWRACTYQKDKMSSFNAF